MILIVEQALSVLGFLPSEQLPERVGVGALECGMDTESIRTLAGLDPSDGEGARTLFRKILAESGLPSMTPQDAARVYAKVVSRQILSEELSPAAAARNLWEVTVRVQVNDPAFHDLDTFVYAVSELEDRPLDREFFEAAIVDEAKDWASNRQGILKGV
jgi:hypothetical protein